jgi:phenylacetate-CoA ligase
MKKTPVEQWIAEKIGSPSGLERVRLECWQLERINETLNLAQNSPFYRKRLGSVSCLQSLDDMVFLPFTFPGDIIREGTRMLSVPPGEIERVVTLDTTGTTGSPKRVYFTRDDQELTVDYFARGMVTLLNPGESMMILLPAERPGSVGELIYRALLRIPARPIAHGLVRSLPDTLAALQKEEAQTLVGVPLQVLAVARYSAARSIAVPVKRVLLSTDNVPRVVVSELNRLWGCEVYEHYGMTEMGLGGAIDCAAHEGMHIREADLYFEIVEPATGRPLPAGEYGEVVFTTLTRRGMPLLRYRTGDISRFLPGPCSCGTVLKRLERIKGRASGRVCLGGDFWLDMPMLDEALFALPQVLDFTARVRPNRGGRTLIVEAVALDICGDIKEKSILDALRSVETVREAERRAGLAIEASVFQRSDIVSLHRGKRCLTLDIGGI